jgi:serine/threonine-protein kinase
MLEGDLDNIALKAIRKEPAERYPSVLSFAEDLHRHAAGLPVRARPATTGYRVRKFVGRNRLAVSGAITLFLVLSAATAITLYQSARIREESARVALERDKALEVRSFLLEMFGSTGPDQAADTVTARQMLDRRRASLEDAYADDPETHAEMLMVLAEGYERLGLPDIAEPLARHALETRTDLLGEPHPDVVVSLNVLGWLERQRGNLDTAETLLARAVDAGRNTFPPEGDPRLARALNDLGVLRMDRSDADGAATHLEESLQMRRRFLGERHIGVAITTSNLSVVQFDRGDLTAAAQTAEAALILFRDLLGPDHQRTLIVRQNLGAFRSAWGDPAGAERWHRQVVQTNAERLGEDHPTVAYGQALLADDLRRLDRLDEAEPLALTSVRSLASAFPNGHRDLAIAWRVLGDTRNDMDNADQALQDYSSGLAVAQRALGQNHEEAAVLLGRIAAVLDKRGETDAANDAFRDATLAASTSLGASHSSSLMLRLLWLEFLVREDRIASARARLAELDSADATTTAPHLNDRIHTARIALPPTRQAPKAPASDTSSFQPQPQP